MRHGYFVLSYQIHFPDQARGLLADIHLSEQVQGPRAFTLNVFSKSGMGTPSPHIVYICQNIYGNSVLPYKLIFLYYALELRVSTLHAFVRKAMGISQPSILPPIKCKLWITGCFFLPNTYTHTHTSSISANGWFPIVDMWRKNNISGEDA
jgi:hypothetical protein